MKTLNALRIIAASAGITWAGASFGHDGHAMTGAHWHATDAWGFVALAAMTALAIWWSRAGKK
jgi:hypothetical protein